MKMESFSKMNLILLLIVFLVVKTQGMKIKFLRYVANNTQYARNDYSFENLDNGEVNINSTIEFFQDVYKELVSFQVKNRMTFF